ncbi:hypothetical protein [Ensifer sp. MJa1]|uniref:hypothetical protein n=1 Tax=Ensifer sp. MJa1 TaxID=2919888 RepID=UPI00300834AD
MTLFELETALATTGDPEPGGKQDAFPTLDAIWADPETDPDAVESPTLIDPTRTDPARHLVWPQAEVSVVLPVVNQQGVECPRASASIHIYALNRIGLVQSRLEVRQKLDSHIKTIRDTAGVAMVSTGLAREALLKIVDDGIISLRIQAETTHVFSAMVSARLSAFEAELVDLLLAD